jgi:formylglycine-generating enzyme required for sulfatase activity
MNHLLLLLALTGCTTIPPWTPAARPGGCPDGTRFVAGDVARIGALCVDRLEVSVADWRRCQACGAPPVEVAWPGISSEERELLAGACNASQVDREDHPMNCVSRDAAAAFCAARGARLPRADEWRWIAGQGRRAYPWGEAGASAERACASLDGIPRGSSCLVGTHPAGATPEGVEDLAGNLWEWTATPRADDPSSAVILGGAFNRGADALGGAVEAACPVVAQTYKVGFRCVRPPEG